MLEAKLKPVGENAAAASRDLPIAVVLRPSARHVIRVIAAVVVGGQVIGTIAALWLAVVYGVSIVSLMLFFVLYVWTTLSVTIGFHRHFAHRSFRTTRWMRGVFVIGGSMAYQGPLVYWVSTHRRHHQFSDVPGDPHSPHLHSGGVRGWWLGFWHSHVGWLFAPDISNAPRFVPDILSDPHVFRMQQRYIVWALLGLALPAVVGLLASGTAYGALEGFLWGGPVRLFVVSNVSWAVGSVSHLWGRRPFETHDHSANNFWVSLLAFGEGLQNNHHAFPAAARHAFHRWEPDLSGWVIGHLERLGLIWDLKHPTPAAIEHKRRVEPATLAERKGRNDNYGIK
jgi:stearoyl-CoA desaturase (delta-9 desaturase)